MLRGDAPRVAARGVAVDARRVGAQEAHAGGRQALHLSRVHALGLEHGTLRVGAAGAVVADAAVAAHDAVARDHEWDRVSRHGVADCPDRERATKLCRYPGVRPDLAAWNLHHLAQ